MLSGNSANQREMRAWPRHKTKRGKAPNAKENRHRAETGTSVAGFLVSRTSARATWVLDETKNGTLGFRYDPRQEKRRRREIARAGGSDKDDRHSGGKGGLGWPKRIKRPPQQKKKRCAPCDQVEDGVLLLLARPLLARRG